MLDMGQAQQFCSICDKPIPQAHEKGKCPHNEDNDIEPDSLMDYV